MEWVIENWAAIIGVLLVLIVAAIGLLRILKPGSPWLSILIYILGVIEDLAPEIAAKVKGEVATKMHMMPAKEQLALQDACAAVDAKKATPESIKKAL